MRQIATVSIAPAAITVPAVLSGAVPSWCVLTLLGVSTLLTATHVVVTEIIRLRASKQITRSLDALRVIEIEDLTHHRQPKVMAHPPAIFCRSRANGDAPPEP